MLFDLNLWTCALLTVLFLAMDALQAAYTKYVLEARAKLAATTGSAIYLFSGVAVVYYTENPAYLAFVVLGSWLGTYSTIRWMSRK